MPGKKLGQRHLNLLQFDFKRFFPKEEVQNVNRNKAVGKEALTDTL